MKKNYQNPETRIFEIKMQPLMDVSNGSTAPNVSVSDTPYDSNEGDILSRRGGSWSDEE